MKRRDYMKPAMQVVELKHQCHILAGSGGDRSCAGVTDYTMITEEEE
jgi:hypothetical protein